MRAIQALFVKQLCDLPKNMSITIMFITFPVVSWVIGGFVGTEDPITAAVMNIQFAMIFVGMTPMVLLANTIAEDNEYKSLRFLMMAGVKPTQYLAGLLSFTVLMSVLPILAFALIGGLSGQTLAAFMALGLLGALASAILGAVIGLFSKNVQQCAALYTPFMMILSFVPFLSVFNETVETVGFVVFTQQIFMSLIYMVVGPEAQAPSFVSVPVSLAIIGANCLVFAILFALAYRKKGLRG